MCCFAIKTRNVFVASLLLIGCLTAVTLLDTPSVAWGQTASDVLQRVKWQTGPATVDLAGIATVKVPKGYMFADASDTKALMEVMQNPSNGTEVGLIAPKDFRWYVIFEFVDTGFISDSERDSLDADAILESIKKGTDAANEERRKRGWARLNISGWEIKPHYDSMTHNLEWAVKGESEGEQVVNYQSRLLGRKGVMKAVLVDTPKTLSSSVIKYKDLLAQYSYTPGNRYEEFTKGDKIAEYGLTGLIVGGAAAAATKGGLLKWAWKMIVAAFVAIGGALKKLFGKKDQ
jgi:uncharacterized membrane-anchored protein